MTRLDFVDRSACSVPELRATLFEERLAVSRPLTVLLLAHKHFDSKVEDMKRLLENEREAPRVRYAAAHVLSLTATPEAIDALRAALEIVRDPLALSGVVEGLAMLGVGAALPAIARLADRDGPRSPAT